MIHKTQIAQISEKKHRLYIYAMMIIMCSLGYHHNDFEATHLCGHIMYGYTLVVPMNQSVLNKFSKERNISDRN